jgi:hypothetical protein
MCSICFANSAVARLPIFVQLQGAEWKERHPAMVSLSVGSGERGYGERHLALTTTTEHF